MNNTLPCQSNLTQREGDSTTTFCINLKKTTKHKINETTEADDSCKTYPLLPPNSVVTLPKPSSRATDGIPPEILTYAVN